MRVLKTMITVVLASFLLAGCGAKSSRLAQPVPVEKGAPVVHIHPLTDTHRQARVGVLPFQVPARMGEAQASGVAALYKEVLLGKRTFPVVMELATPYSDIESAVEIGRKQGVDLVLAGRVDYCLDGGDLGGARVGVTVRLVSTATGNTVWYVSQTMDQPMDYPDVSFLNRLATSFSIPAYRGSNGAPAVPNMLARIAVDMAEVFAGAQYVARR
ncbi:MAG: hypothetical protein OEV91_08020 [Desulfobulbaceae bacterium]|nr:hypothetical protein [Desulfobulbaceae bacterium]